MTSFAALRAVSAVSREDHRVHLEGVPPSGWQTMPCERANHKEDGQILCCRGLTFLSPDAAAPLFHLEGSVGEFSKELSPFWPVESPLLKRLLTGFSLPSICGASPY